MEDDNLEFNELLNDLEPHIFNFILDNLSEVPSDLSKKEQIEFITSNYSQDTIDDLIDEYNAFEIETTETLDSLEDDIFGLVTMGLDVPEDDKEEQISYIITNYSKDKIEYAIYEAELKRDIIEELEELDDEQFNLIVCHFNLSDEIGERETLINCIFDNYSISQVKTAMEIADKKMVFYNDMLGFDDDVFSFICFNYSSLDYNNFKALENKESRKDKAYYLISNYSPSELHQKASEFVGKIDLFNSLDTLDEVFFRILIKNMNAYSFFLDRIAIIYNLMINYSDYIIYIEMDKARESFKTYDELRNLEDIKLLFLANYLNAPEEMIENWINVSDFDNNIFKDYDVNPKNHIISFYIDDEEEEKEEELEVKRNKLFGINYFDFNPLKLSPKEEIAYYIYKNKSEEDIIEGLNSFPNVIVDSDGNLVEGMNDSISNSNLKRDTDNDSDDNLDDSDNKEGDNISSNDDSTVKVDIEGADDGKSDEVEVKISDEDSDSNKTLDESDKDNSSEDSDDADKDSNSAEDLEGADGPEVAEKDSSRPEVSKEEFTKMLNELDGDVFKILTKKLAIVENNKVSIIDHIVSNYNYYEIEDRIKLISFKKDHYVRLDALDDATFSIFLKEFSTVPNSFNRFEKIDYIINNYSYGYIESRLEMVLDDIREIKRSLADDDIFFEIATYFKLPLHATKEEQIDYLLINYDLIRVRKRIAFYEGKLHVEGLIRGIVDKNKIECPYCGAKIKKDAKYCTNCGEKLSININID